MTREMVTFGDLALMERQAQIVYQLRTLMPARFALAFPTMLVEQWRHWSEVVAPVENKRITPERVQAFVAWLEEEV